MSWHGLSFPLVTSVQNSLTEDLRFLIAEG